MRISFKTSDGARGKQPKRLGRWLLTISTALLAAAALFALSIWINSPGEPEGFQNGDGIILKNSISEKVFVEINGVKQGMFLRGINIENPVLLFAHGGPCFPEYFLFDRYETGLEKEFTVCYWEQRGGGLSYTKGMDPSSVTMEQLKQDTIAVSEFLCNRFGQEQIYLMAHSGGTFFAIQAAAERPELYRAYIGVAQIADQMESERRAYEYIYQRSEQNGDQKTLRQLAEYPVPVSDEAVRSFFRSMLRDQTMHALGVGTTRTMRSVIKDVFLPVWFCKGYTVQEKIKLWASKFGFINQTNIKDELLSTNLILQVKTLNLPVYFLSGAYDMTVNHDLSQSFLAGLTAPVKGFYTFEHSAHSPMVEEPERMLDILRSDVLTGGNSLAD